MGNSIVWFVGVAILFGIVLTNPKGSSTVINSLSSAISGETKALEVSKG